MTQYTALIVDDEPDILELLDVTLSRMNINSITAGTLAEAKQAIIKGGFDLCLTDMKLPDGDGIELIIFLQQQHPEIPIIAQTAYTLTEDRMKCMQAGFNDYISKPINRLALFRLVNENLS